MRILAYIYKPLYIRGEARAFGLSSLKVVSSGFRGSGFRVLDRDSACRIRINFVASGV